MLCHAVSEKCEKRNEYIARIMGMNDRSDVQRELMRIIQENAQSSCAEENADTGDYSELMNLSAEFEDDCDSDNLHDSTMDAKRGREWVDAFEENSGDSDMPQKKKRNHDEDPDIHVEEKADDPSTSQNSEKELNELHATVAKLQQELQESRQHEMGLTSKVDELESQHRAELLRMESESLQIMKNHEDKYTAEIIGLKKKLETLRECERSAVELKEEVTRLRDELDVVQFSKEKLAFTEEQLRKCREKIEQMGDAQDALEREEKAHATSVEKCLRLENELAQLKPLKRQLEEYKIRADEAEVALTECRDDLRRLKEKSSGLEGANKALKRGAFLQQAEAGDLQKRIQEGVENGQGGHAVGVGLR